MIQERKNVVRRIRRTAKTMVKTAQAMRQLLDADLLPHAAELEGAASVMETWAKGIIESDAQWHNPPPQGRG